MSHVLIANNKGNYSFARGIAPYSAGVIAAPGFEIVHARFIRPLPLTAGLAALRDHVIGASRPLTAVCGIELRSPKPFTFEGFNNFNRVYVQAIKDLGIIEGDTNPVARTNIAPAIGAPSEPALYGFSYTAPSETGRPTFVVAGSGELPDASLDPKDLVRSGETSADAIREKALFVVSVMAQRLHSLGMSWDQATTVNVYTVHSIGEVLDSLIREMSTAAVHGLNWHYAHPPILSIEYEMDVRSANRELVL